MGMISLSQVMAEAMPSPDEVASGWTIRRAPAEGAVPYVCVSGAVFGIRTHYWKGRTVPCMRHGCEAHEAGQASRWHGYVLALNTITLERVVFEFPATASGAFEEIKRLRGTLRGWRFQVSRAARRANARVVVISKGYTDDVSKLPDDESVWPIIAKIWGYTAIAETGPAGPGRAAMCPADLPASITSGGSGKRRARSQRVDATEEENQRRMLLSEQLAQAVEGNGHA